MNSLLFALRENIVLRWWQWTVLIVGAFISIAFFYADGFLVGAATVLAIFLIISPIRKRWLAYLAIISTVLASLVLLLNNLILADILLTASFLWATALTCWLLAHYRHLPADEDRKPAIITEKWNIGDYAHIALNALTSLDSTQQLFTRRSVRVIFYLINTLVISIYLFIFGIELPSAGTSIGFSAFFVAFIVGNAVLWWYDHKKITT
jgi:hypothetical protein